MLWAKKWSPDLLGIFQTYSRIVQSRKNGTCSRLDFEDANAAKLCEARALGLEYCSLVVQERHHELGSARSSIEKEEKGASKRRISQAPAQAMAQGQKR